MVRAVFAVAAAVQPTIIFVDEVDSLLSTRKETDDAIWRLKTEFLIHLDGITSSQKDKITLIAATNIPYSKSVSIEEASGKTKHFRRIDFSEKFCYQLLTLNLKLLRTGSSSFETISKANNDSTTFNAK